ncbi:MAG: response regulator [Proteobacteria bacterium]|nr:response regulator [Pseudomonadota bacterium]
MPQASSFRVLVVDDQHSMRGLTRYSLGQMGVANVVDVSSAQAAVDEIGKAQFNLILSDYNMPEMSGMDLLKTVRRHPTHSKVPFIMLTGQGDKELVTEAAKAGVNNYVIKPFTVDVLRKKIEAVVGALT